MTYSTDLRKRVLDFIQSGGTKAEAARRFSVNHYAYRNRHLKVKRGVFHERLDDTKVSP